MTGILGPRRSRRGWAPRSNLDRAIGVALVDRTFCSQLIRVPAEVAEALNLSPEELEVLKSANAGSLEELAAHVHLWIMEASGPALSPAPCHHEDATSLAPAG